MKAEQLAIHSLSAHATLGMHVEVGVEKSGQKLEDVTTLDADTFAEEVCLSAHARHAQGPAGKVRGFGRAHAREPGQAREAGAAAHRSCLALLTA
jgi:hypothetical protein